MPAGASRINPGESNHHPAPRGSSGVRKLVNIMIKEGSIEALWAEKLAALKKSVNSNAYVSFHVIAREGGDCYLDISLYPDGLLGNSQAIHGHGDSFDACLADLENQWIVKSAQHAESCIQKMAHEIIDITHRTGSCTNLVLGATFSAEEIERHGAAAVARANEMSAKGPFEIVTEAGANHWLP
jgi:hypothetical protein